MWEGDSKGCTPVFGDAWHCEATPDTRFRGRRVEIQDGGRRTGSSYNFGRMWLARVIPMAIPTFSKQLDTTEKRLTPSSECTLSKFNIAATKPDVVRT
jgi:hypothetical protein